MRQANRHVRRTRLLGLRWIFFFTLLAFSTLTLIISTLSLSPSSLPPRPVVVAPAEPLRDAGPPPPPRPPPVDPPPRSNDASLSDLVLPGLEYDCIPNVVHFVKVDRGTRLFNFIHWVSAYSACRNLNATRLEYHVDVEPTGLWWNLVKSLPCEVHVSPGIEQVVWSETRSLNVSLKKAQHVSDFARFHALMSEGGIYMDTDAVPLRRFSPELTCGKFGVVLGYQNDEKREVAVGVMAARRGLPWVRRFYEHSKAAFDGNWSTHSVKLLSDVLAHQQGNPGFKLLSQDAFYPFYSNLRALAGQSRKDAVGFSWCSTFAFHYFASHPVLKTVLAAFKSSEPMAPCLVLKMSTTGSPIHLVSAAFVCDALSRNLLPQSLVSRCSKLVPIVCSSNYSSFFPCPESPSLFH